MARFSDDLNELVTTHRVPVRHRIRVRTTNLAKRSFVDECPRTRSSPAATGKAARKLVCATLIRTADRWCGVSISDLERHHLTLLRGEFGLDPPPADTADRKPTDTTTRPNDHQATDLQDTQDVTCASRDAEVAWITP